MNKKYQIFISSTYNDLKAERQKVCDAVLALYQIPIGMEMFSAADEEQWEIIKSHIDDTDYYVLIIGNRYGSVIQDGPDKGISYTEKEYNYAVSQGVPVLAYLIDEDVPVKPSYVEKENVDKLKDFKERVCDGREVVWWKTPDELATKVSQSLFKQIHKGKRPGWCRANALNDIGDVFAISTTKPATENDRNPTSESDTWAPLENQAKETDDIEKQVAEICRIYVEDILPVIERSRSDSNSYPEKGLIQIKEAFDNIATCYVYRDEERVDRAFHHIIRAGIECLKYRCYIVDEECKAKIKKIGPFLRNSESSYYPRRLDRAEHDVFTFYSSAKNALARADYYEDDVSMRALRRYERALTKYDDVCSIIAMLIKDFMIE